MDRLVDYFAVVGYDFTASEDNLDRIKGKLISRIPEQDWDDEPFIQGIELFCQPAGWFLLKERQPPKFFVCVLTDAFGKRHYCAVLSFSEPINPANVKSSAHSPNPPHVQEEIQRKGSTRDVDSPTSNNFVEEFVDESMCQVETNHENQDSAGNNLNDTSEEYSPKCLVLLSRHQEFEVLKNCLGLIYTIYIEGLTVSLETVIANLLVVNVPPRGSSAVRFSIGAADKQALQSPQYEELPVTRSSVSMLLHQLGILNVMNILSAALVDQKLLFYSCSFTRLTESCNALTALMFPFSYSYPYIPILPRNLLECTASPTPFLIGTHSSLKSELHDLVDVITVDLDGGVISVPECITIPGIPEPYYTRAIALLTKVLCPDLVVADYAYPPEHINTSEPEKLDKEIRAIFLRLFCQLLMGYRSCLQVCRIHPQPIIRFQKDLFLEFHGYDRIESGSSMDFMPKLLNSQAFSLFIQEQGPPYRKLNIFDHLLAEMSAQLKKEGDDIKKALRHVKDIAYQLYRNEHPSALPPTQRVPKPSESAYLRPHQNNFPKISPTAVQTFMADKLNNSKNSFKNQKAVERPCLRVPDGVSLNSFLPGTRTTSSRRLEVLRNCVQFIFENKTLETKKIFHAVLRALKSRAAREALVRELNMYAKMKPNLDNQQFEYIARLCNRALEDCSGETDEYIFPGDLLPALSAFYRKLCPTVMQFLYTEVQEHVVWASISFWEFTFFTDVQKEMGNLYRSRKATVKISPHGNDIKDTSSLRGDKISPSIWMKRSASAENFINIEGETSRKDMNTYNERNNSVSLDIAATELRDVVFRSTNEKKELSLAEEGVIVGQIQHTCQRIIFMVVPLDGSRLAAREKYLRYPGAFNEDSSNSYFTSSLAGSINGSIDIDFNDPDVSDASIGISKFVSMFVDKACSETAISADFSKSLLSKVPNLVLMQHETLHDVCRESKHLPPVKKAKLLQPKMLPGETLFPEQTLRAFLSADGRLIATGDSLGGPALLPSEGALFLTTYRLIFIGIPCDALASEQVVIRSFPIAALYKMKLFSDSDRCKSLKLDPSIQINHWCLLISVTFQLIVVGFDEDDVGEERRLAFEEKLHSLRNPATIDGAFAIRMGARIASKSNSPVRGKHGKDFRGSPGKSGHGDGMKGSSRHGAKSLMKHAKKKAGMTLGKQPRLSRLVMADGKSKTLYFPSTSAGNDHSLLRPNSLETLTRVPPMNETLTKTLTEKGTMDRLFQRACQKDYKRMNLIGGRTDQFRLTNVNRMFSICRSYPVCMVVPKSISDDSIKSLAHCHHLNRFPCVTWIHPATKAVLLHSGAIRSRTVSAIFKHGQATQTCKNQPVSDEGTLGSSAEEERFLYVVISSSESSSPIKIARPESALFKPSLSSSLGSINDEEKSPMSRGNNGFASSFRESRPDNTSALKSMRKWGTLSRATGKPTPDHTLGNNISGSRSGLDRTGYGNGTLNVPGSGSNRTTSYYHAMARKAQLYVFGDKSQLKSMKQEQQGKVEFIPIDLPEPKQVRASHKMFLKSCLPMDPPPPPQSAQAALDDNQLFRKAIEDSGWLQQLSSLLSVAGAIVDVMDVQGASVMIAMEDGWDVTPQISSLAQIMLDPYYRTTDGFKTLVQKEWLSFGHRFSHRNRFNENISSGYTPIFLQFLDCVYQVLQQFPLAFEFNSMYLQTLAYHCTSNRFQTFILDSDFERLEAGILFTENRSRRKPSEDSLEDKPSPEKKKSPRKLSTPLSVHPRQIKSLWEYIELAHQRSPIFLNTLYSPDFDTEVLRPVSTVCRLHIWPFYTHEYLGDCPIYDGLLNELNTGASHNEQDTTEASEAWGGKSGRRVVNSYYDNISEVQPDAVKSLILRIENLQTELSKPIDSWHSVLKTAKTASPKIVKIPNPTYFAREQAKSLHKKLTVDIIVKHSMKEESSLDSVSIAGDMGTIRPMDNDDVFDTASVYKFQTNVSEVRTYEGTLWKRGAYMKNWKQRFFVLDSTKHQLRQYESKVDQTCKSVFDLKEVESVQLIDAISNAPKGVEDNSFFEMRTSKRLYYFIAENDEAAKKWIDVLQSAIQG